MAPKRRSSLNLIHSTWKSLSSPKSANFKTFLKREPTLQEQWTISSTRTIIWISWGRRSCRSLSWQRKSGILAATSNVLLYLRRNQQALGAKRRNGAYWEIQKLTVVTSQKRILTFSQQTKNIKPHPRPQSQDQRLQQQSQERTVQSSQPQLRYRKLQLQNQLSQRPQIAQHRQGQLTATDQFHRLLHQIRLRSQKWKRTNRVHR